MLSRIYTIENKDDQTAQMLVEATSKAQALAFVANMMFEARPASGKDVADAIKHGLVVMDATSKPAPTPFVIGVPGGTPVDQVLTQQTPLPI